MKKKLIACLLLGCMALSLAACGAKQEGSAPADDSNPAEATESTPSLSPSALMRRNTPRRRTAPLLQKRRIPPTLSSRSRLWRT